MRLLVDIAVAIIVAVIIGFSTAWVAIEYGHRLGGVRVGPWTAWPGASGPNADPYWLARLARSGEVPLGAGEGLAFVAATDSTGEPLSGGCTYMVSGETPSARLWTLTAYDEAGHLMANAARRQGFHSRELLRLPDGDIDITVSPSVQPGDWLPVTRLGRFRLVLRLYDTPLTTATEVVHIEMPRIDRERCE